LYAVTETAVGWERRDFFRLWSAQATGLVGQQFSVLAIPLVAITTLHASAPTVALVGVFFNVPTLLFGLVVGVPIDRMRRRTVLIASDVGRALLFCTIPLFAALGILTLPQLFVLGIVIGSLDLCWLTAYRSYVPAIVPSEHLPRAYSMVGASDAITRTAAPSLAGAAIQLLGAPMGISVTSACYCTSGLFNSRIRATERVVSRHEPVLRAFRDGLVYVWRHRTVRTFAFSEATYILFWAASQSVTLVYLNRNLGFSAGIIGLTFTAGAIGGIVSAFFARRIGDRIGSRPATILGSLLRGGGLALLPITAVSGIFAIPVLMIARIINSFGWTLWDVHRETTQQRLISEEYRARTNSAIIFTGGAALTLGNALGAGIVAVAGVLPTIVIGGCGALLATAWLCAPAARNT
jgi:MFS family permease